MRWGQDKLLAVALHLGAVKLLQYQQISEESGEGLQTPEPKNVTTLPPIFN